MSASVALIAGCALTTAAIRVAGPVALGGRPMPPAFTAIVTFLAPALLAALVVTQALADARQLALGADSDGVAAGGLVAWRTRSPVGAVVAAALVTAALRAASD